MSTTIRSIHPEKAKAIARKAKDPYYLEVRAQQTYDKPRDPNNDRDKELSNVLKRENQTTERMGKPGQGWNGPAKRSHGLKKRSDYD